MKSILVIGMGRFGTYLAMKLTELGNQVMIADKDEDKINRLSHHFTDAIIGDCSREEVLEEIGVNNFDICFVTMGESFQSSLEVTSLLKDMGAKYVVTKSCSEIQSKFLLRNGADEVVYPERDLATTSSTSSSWVRTTACSRSKCPTNGWARTSSARTCAKSTGSTSSRSRKTTPWRLPPATMCSKTATM